LLSREINHVRNVIDINQLRFNNKLNIDFQLQGNPGTHRIIPLVLVTLIENAFKHGELNDPDEALTITICISDQEKKFRCRIKNKKGKNTVEVSHGIGMQNIRNRLELNYRDNYSLDITDEQEFYSVDLQLNL
jgi:two-component system LytT family sensor kinase